MTKTIRGGGRTDKSQVESETSDDEDLIDDSNPIRVPINNSPESTDTTTGPKFAPHYLLSKWEVAGSAVQRI